MAAAGTVCCPLEIWPRRRLERASGVRFAAPGYHALGSVAMYGFFERIGAFIPGV